MRRRATTNQTHRARNLGLLAVAGAVAAELTYRQRVKSDPQFENFQHPLHGEGVRTTSADGTEIYAEVFGADAAPTFLLVPGWTEQLRYFDPVTRILVDRGFRVVSYDLRGQGQSSRPATADDHVLERYGQDLEAVLTATCEGRQDVIVAGHSMGGMSVVAWAGQFKPSERVKAAALMNTGQRALVTESQVIPARVPLPIREAVGNKVVLSGTAPYMPFSNPMIRSISRYMAFGPDSTAAQVAFYAPMMWEMHPRARGAAGVAMSQLDQLWAVSKLDVPTLVIAGDSDRMTPPSHARQTASELPHLVDVVVLNRTGHMAPLERSAEVADELCKLAASVGIAEPNLTAKEPAAA
jgi:pimeloyl-ACP methyl ester carboxylesterase